MVRKNGELHKLVKKGEAVRHRGVSSKSASKGTPFRTFRLKEGVKIEKASKSAG